MYCKEALNVNKNNSKELWKLINSVILNKRANNQIVKKLLLITSILKNQRVFPNSSTNFLLKLDKKLRTMLIAKHLMIIFEPI